MSGIQSSMSFPTLPKSPELQQAESGPSTISDAVLSSSSVPRIRPSTSPSTASGSSPQARRSVASTFPDGTQDSTPSSSAAASIGFPAVARPISRASLASSRPSSVASNSSSTSSSHVHGQLAACPGILTPGLASALGLVPSQGPSGSTALARKEGQLSHRRIRAQSSHAPVAAVRRPSLPTVPSMHHRISVASVSSFESLPEDEIVHGFGMTSGPGCLPKGRNGSYERSYAPVRSQCTSPSSDSTPCAPAGAGTGSRASRPSTNSPSSSPSKLAIELDLDCSLHDKETPVGPSTSSASTAPRPSLLKRSATEPSKNSELRGMLVRRRNAAMELLESEKSFMASLRLIEEEYYKPLMASIGRANGGAASPSLAAPNGPILSRKAIAEIFSNFPDILQLSKELLSRLEDRLRATSIATPAPFDGLPTTADEQPGHEPRFRRWDPALDTVGDVLVPLAPFMKMYGLYVKNFSGALQRIEAERKANEAFAQFLKETEQRRHAKEMSDSAATGKRAFGFGLGLQAHLLTIVQRIPRYKLLVDDLITSTPDTHVDRSDLIKAGHTIEQVASYINENVRQHEMVLMMLSLQRSLQGLTEPLVVPGRTLIKRGTLMKTCRRNIQPREFFLFTDCIIYASPISGGMESASAAWSALAQKGSLYSSGVAESVFGSSSGSTSPVSPGDATAAIETVLPRTRLRTISGPEAYTPLAGAIFSLAGHQLQFRNKLPLRDCTVVSVEDHSLQGLRHCFEIRSPEKSFAVYAETSASKEAWVAAIREARGDFLSARRTLRSEEDSLEARRDKRRSQHRIDLPGTGRRLSTQSLGQYIGLGSTPSSIPEAETETGETDPDSLAVARTRTESAPNVFRPPSFPSFSSTATAVSFATLLSTSANATPTKPLRVMEDYNAPVWVPDNRADKCACCSEVFGMWRRKHHCRLCGQVVCWNCSQRSFLIPAFQEGEEDKAARACDGCYDSIFAPDSPNEPATAPQGSVGCEMTSGVSNDGSRTSVASSGLFDSDTSPGSPATPGGDGSPRFAQPGSLPLGSPPSSATLRQEPVQDKVAATRSQSLRFDLDRLGQTGFVPEARDVVRSGSPRSRSIGAGFPLAAKRASVVEAQLFQAALRPQVEAATSGSGTFRLVTPRLTTPESELPPNLYGRKLSQAPSKLVASGGGGGGGDGATSYFGPADPVEGVVSGSGSAIGGEALGSGWKSGDPFRPSMMHGPNGIPAHLRPQKKRPMSAADRLSTFYGANLALSGDGKKK